MISWISLHFCWSKSIIFYQIFFKLAGNEDMHKISDEIEFRTIINEKNVKFEEEIFIAMATK